MKKVGEGVMGDWDERTADVDDTELVTDEVFTLSGLQTVFNNAKESSSLILVSFDSVWDLFRSVSATLCQHSASKIG